MEREKLREIINKIDEISNLCNDDDLFNLAIYIYARYGLHKFDNYIDDYELEEINKVLKRYNSIFDEVLNEDVAIIVNDVDY